MAITPETNLKINIEEEALHDITYKIDFENNRILNLVDNLEAVKQTIYCILNTERYENTIYSWSYGSELQNFIGKDKDFIIGDIKRRISEALLQDNRIFGIDSFEYVIKQDVLTLNFIVQTEYGKLDIEQAVNI